VAFAPWLPALLDIRKSNFLQNARWNDQQKLSLFGGERPRTTAPVTSKDSQIQRLAMAVLHPCHLTSFTRSKTAAIAENGESDHDDDKQRV
jgi:hypothetical protein